jgi:transcriptional regulator with XRE-family HTH domain
MDVRELYRSVGRRIGEVRASRGVTQEQLAEQLDVTVGYVQQVETGRKNLSLKSLATFADALGATVPEFFTPPQSPVKPGRPSRRRTIAEGI